MSSQIPLVLLPGLDGSGELFTPLLKVLPEVFAPRVVSYPGDQSLDYATLVQTVLPQLPRSGPYLLLGESFSGPVAMAVAHQAPHPPCGLVLCCTFAACPRPRLSRWLDWIPSLPPVHALSPWLLKNVLFGRWARPDLLEAMGRALAQVHPKVLYTRLQGVHGVDARADLAACSMPIQYWQASEDRLVPAEAFGVVRQAAPHSLLLRFEGPHALLQTRPDRAVEALAAFAVELGLIGPDARPMPRPPAAAPAPDMAQAMHES